MVKAASGARQMGFLVPRQIIAALHAGNEGTVWIVALVQVTPALSTGFKPKHLPNTSVSRTLLPMVNGPGLFRALILEHEFLGRIHRLTYSTKEKG